jgi:hypothetical protein
MLGIIIALIFLSGSATARHITHAMQRHCAVSIVLPETDCVPGVVRLELANVSLG